MKIVQISSKYPPSSGGVQNVSKEISERLAKKGHQVEVFTSNIGCPKDKQIKSTKNLKINYLPAWEFAHTPIIPGLFSRLMKIPKNSIIHVHVAQAFVPEIVWLVSKIRKIPYICQIHSDVQQSGKLGFLLPFYKTIFLKKVLCSAEEIIVLTKDYKNLIIDKYPINSTKIHIIPNGVNEDFFINKKFKIQVKNLLFVGRLTTGKNILKLIEAVSLLKNKVTLHIVGDGELRECSEKLTKKKRLTNISFHGRKEGRDLTDLYKNADILILPSYAESFGLVLLEAMASSTPIVSSDILGIRSVVKNGYNGLLVEPTPEKIAEAIEKLIKNPKLRKKLAENGLKEVKKYSWDKIVEQTEQVYREVLAEHNKKKNKK